MRIQHNIAALNSYRQLGTNNNAVAKNLEKLSSGYKINRAGDDAAGLAISEKMRAQITGLETAQKNAEDGISLVQTAEGALAEVHSMLNRMAELATQSANGTYSDAVDRENLQAEVDALRSEIDRISESTNFNGINLLDGSLGGPKKDLSTGEVLQTGAVIGDPSIQPPTGNKTTFDFSKASFNAGNAYIDVQYVDETGAEQTRSIAFETVAGDKEATLKNLQDAINNDVALKGLFKASVGSDKTSLVVESLSTGSGAVPQVKGFTVNQGPNTVEVTASAPTLAGTNTEYKLGTVTVAQGDTWDIGVTIDGKYQNLSFQAGAGGAGDFKTDLETALKNAGFADYEVTVTGGTVGDNATTFAIQDTNGLNVEVNHVALTLTNATSGKSEHKLLYSDNINIDTASKNSKVNWDLDFSGFTMGTSKDFHVNDRLEISFIDEKGEVQTKSIKLDKDSLGLSSTSKLSDVLDAINAQLGGGLKLESDKDHTATGVVDTTDGFLKADLGNVSLSMGNGANKRYLAIDSIVFRKDVSSDVTDTSFTTDTVAKGITSTKTDGKKESWGLSVGDIDLKPGQIRDLDFSFKKDDATDVTVSIRIRGGLSKEETAKAIIDALKNHQDADLQEVLKGFDITTDRTGNLTFTAKETGDTDVEFSSFKVQDNQANAGNIEAASVPVDFEIGKGATSIGQVDASGNRYKLSAADLELLKFNANNVTAYLDVNYVDEDGNKKTKTVQFNTGTSKEAGLQNFVNAINGDKDLAGVFKATFQDGELQIESLEKGEGAKAKIESITVNEDPNAASGMKVKTGENTTYGFDTLTNTKNNGNFDDGDAIRIKKGDKELTYTYKSAGTADPNANQFTTLEDLKKLLEADGITMLYGAGDDSTAADTSDLGLNGKLGKEIIFQDANGMDVDNVQFIEAGQSGAADVKRADGEEASFTLNTIDLKEGQQRNLTFKYINKSGTEMEIRMNIVGGKTKAETAEQILKYLKEDDYFMKESGFAGYDAAVDENGNITFTAKNTGSTDVGTIGEKLAIKGIDVTTENGANGVTLKGTHEDAKDAHLNLEGIDFTTDSGEPKQATIKIGDKEYTFRAGSDGSDGETFGSLDALKNAAKQNGVTLEGTDDYLVAKYAPKVTLNFDGRVGADMIGASIDFGGHKFQFVEADGTYKEASENMTYIEISKTANAEEIAAAVAKAMTGMKTPSDKEDANSENMTWTSELVENTSGKKTVVEINADILGDMPAVKFDGFGINLQVGDTNDEYQKVKVGINSMDCDALGVADLSISNQTAAGEAVADIKNAINVVSAQRGKLGAVQNRLDHTINNLGVTTENITAAESRIRDTDMASEMMAYTKNNILIQSAQAMLAQANTLPQGVLQLLQ